MVSYSRYNLPKIKDGEYVINLDEFKSIGTHWIDLYAKSNIVIYFGSFKVIKNKNTITNIYRIQAYDSIICEYVCIGFIDFMLKGKSLLDFANLFLPNDYEKNDKIILKYCQ